MASVGGRDDVAQPLRAVATVVDSQATIVDGDRCVLYVWYDNEYGYSNQVIRVMQKVVGLNFVDVTV